MRPGSTVSGDDKLFIVSSICIIEQSQNRPSSDGVLANQEQRMKEIGQNAENSEKE
jgi:hypothetical protein